MHTRLDVMPLGMRRRSLPLTKIERETTVQNLPVEKYNYSNSEYHFELPHDATPCGSEGSKFDKMLLQRWADAKRAGALQYDLNLLYKTLPGRFGLSAQLNMERATHRRKPHSFRNLNEPFDSRRFNFTKIRQEEILFELCNANSRTSDHPPPAVEAIVTEEKQKIDNAPVTSPVSNVPAGLSNSQRSIIIVNNSPIEKGHSLLVPLIDKHLPQRISFDGFKLAVETMLLSSCRMFFIVYNSLLGHASVNHLHFHMYYWPYVSRIVTWPVTHISGPLYSLDSWIISGFVLQLQNNDLDGFVKKVIAMIQVFHQKSVPHNLFMARAPNLSLLDKQHRSEIHGGENHANNTEAASSGDAQRVDGEADEAASDANNLRQAPLFVTVYIFPRKAAVGAKPTMNFSPAACECAGHLLIYTSTFFQAVHEARILHIIEEEAYLEDGMFDQLKDELKKLPAFAPKG